MMTLKPFYGKSFTNPRKYLRVRLSMIYVWISQEKSTMVFGSLMETVPMVAIMAMIRIDGDL
jgi:hypothetical protein